ncbi:MAG: pyridoxal phosphate-dependent aminotransferase [Desulfohalobiaceae bacterium]|nr:pyridoxal phosphate-dependent aminotransferase [Desulfohalobiaceae bacterium]
MHSSELARKIKPFLAMDVLESAQKLEAEGQDIVHLEIGEPDFETPVCIKEAAIKALQDGRTHYTHSLGLLELREAICEDYFKRYKVAIHPDQIVVTSGTSPAMLLCFAALLEPGDSVIISDPGYACYANFILHARGIPVPVAVNEEDGFQFRVQDIRQKIETKTRAVMINSPANPTGTLLSKERMEQLAGLEPCILSDEVYHGLEYGEKGHSILEFTDRAFVFNGFSKLYAMTGWRLGYAIAPWTFARDLRKLAQNLFICAPAMNQWAGIAALKEAGPDVSRMVKTYDQRRKFMLSRLKELGFGIKTEPKGAFYILANSQRFGTDSCKLAFDILEKAHVGVTPGIDFGRNAEGFLRFSYANSLENIKLGMDRLQEYIEMRGKEA